MQQRKVTVLVLAAAVVAGCDAPADPVGAWQLWSLDGRSVEAGIQQREELPPELAGEVAGEIWTENHVLSGELELRDDGTFVETQVQRRVLVVSAAAYEDLTGSAWDADEPYREEQGTDTLTYQGSWSVVRDSVMLRQNPDQARGEVAAQLRALFPQASEAELRVVVDSALREFSIPPRFRGTVARNRLEGSDIEGRSIVFRRLPAGGDPLPGGASDGTEQNP